MRLDFDLRELILVTLIGLAFKVELTQGVCVEKLRSDGSPEVTPWRRSLLKSPGELEISPVDFSVRKTRIIEAPYELELSMFNQHYNLSLQKFNPNSSVFADEFTFLGKTWSRAELTELEEKIFVDVSSKAVLEVVEEDGEFTLEGFLNGIGIRRDNCAHLAVRQLVNDKEEEKFCDKTAKIKDEMSNDTDTDTVKEPEPLNPNVSPSVKAKADLAIELEILFDGGFKEEVGEKKLVTYAAVLTKSANLIYTSLRFDPELVLKLIKVDPLSDEDNKNVVEDTKHLIELMLKRLYPIKSKDSDVTMLLTTVITQSYDAKTNKVTSTTRGLAAFESACGAYGAGVVRDFGAVYHAVQIYAHEIGHTVGANHDQESPPEKCGNARNVMSYSRSGHPDGFKFSSCSQDELLAFVPKATCLFDTKKEAIKPAKELPGERAGITKQCEKFLKLRDCQMGPMKDEPIRNCLEYKCPVLQGGGCETSGTITFKDITDGTSCKLGATVGKCLKGYCEKSTS